jgi:hypothetical protein
LLDDAFTVGTAKFVSDVLFMGMSFTTLVFYLYSAAGENARARRRVRREAAGFAGATTVVLAAAVAAPGQAVLASTFADADMAVPQVLAFYLGLGLYMIYALTVAGVMTCRYARLSKGIDAAALWTATAGLAGSAVFTSVRSGLVCARAAGATVPDGITVASAWLLAASLPVFVLGVSWPGIRAGWVSTRLWFHHRRVYRGLEPLWRLLSSVYPDTVLPAAGRRNTVRYVRRVIECRDGLLRISPHLGIDSDIQFMAPAELALRLRHAVDRIQEGGSADPLLKVPVAVTRHSGTEVEEVCQLMAVSEALRLLPADAR